MSPSEAMPTSIGLAGSGAIVGGLVDHFIAQKVIK
jgi:hypothetical protein